MPDDADDEVTSVHEAGHAVAALQLGIPLKIVKLSETVGSYCLIDCKKGDWSPETPHSTIERYLIYLAAGAEAEQALLRQASVGGGADDEQAEEGLMRLAKEQGRTRNRVRDAVMNRARELVQQHHLAIEKTAAALRKHRELSGKDVQSIVDQSRI